MLKRLPTMLKIALIVPLISGCAIRIGPQVETKFVVVQPGSPVQIMDDRKVKVSVKMVTPDGTLEERFSEMSVAGRVAIHPDEYIKLLRYRSMIRDSLPNDESEMD